MKYLIFLFVIFLVSNNCLAEKSKEIMQKSVDRVYVYPVMYENPKALIKQSGRTTHRWWRLCKY